MTDVRRLVARLAAQEAAQPGQMCFAPCVPGGRLRVRIEGLLRTFKPVPPESSGWGLFELQADGTARWVASADPMQIEQYLERLPVLRVHLVQRLRGKSWLAWPVSESDYETRFGKLQPLTVSLVSEGDRFDGALVRADGSAWWFEQVDRASDPRPAERLRAALQSAHLPEAVKFPGLTPEMRTAYGLAAQQLAEFEAWRTEQRLRAALALGQAVLEQFQVRDDHWVVTWTTATGERHVSAIAPADLTVVSAGICLSGGDAAFDLQSLPGVVDGA